MRNVKVAVAFTLLALAGCTSTTTGNAPLGESSTTVTTTGSSAAPTTLSSPGETQPTAPPPQTSAAPLQGGPTEVSANQVDGSTLPDHYKRQAWTSADGRTVQVVGLAGGCKSASAEVTAESADQVSITLVTTYYAPPTGVMCTQELRDVPLNVTLDAPLGSRRIVLEARDDSA
ncbi:hypothetical protein IOD16_05645 [Saccharothrix sp. 6-C]|uniref:hypothetical protein n=1 Tax=Saccharothrix sp. 6-C TaxID=2781735 RepID=UPI001916DACF|nr:hypothetical protein [Saccharothrix sp. 6-C]QQQ77973.1 hypothetical protein IOD16_05645 [Saccharothrix sp. 6-C]